MVLITEKPTTKKVGQMGSTVQDMEHLKKKLEVLTSEPKKKYQFAMTSAQEVGWDNEEVRPLPDPGPIAFRGTQT